MENKYFKVSYQRVKEAITFIVFVVIATIIIKSYREFIVNFHIKEIVSASAPPVEIILLVGVLSWVIYLAYLLIKGCVGLFYKSFNNEKWYTTLTHNTIQIPPTIAQHESIKNNKIFFTKYPNDTNPTFSNMELEKWADKIINNVLKKLGGKTK